MNQIYVNVTQEESDLLLAHEDADYWKESLQNWKEDALREAKEGKRKIILSDYSDKKELTATKLQMKSLDEMGIKYLVSETAV